MKRFLFILYIAFSAIFVSAQDVPLLDYSDKVGFLDSTYTTDGISFELARYFNRVEVESIHDGDTPTLQILLGFGTVRIERFRLYGIQAPEIRHLATRPQGEASRAKLIELTNSCDYLFVHTFPGREYYDDYTGKYGRYVGVLYGVCGELIISINDRMVEYGQAIYKDY